MFAPLRLIRAFAAQCSASGNSSIINIGDGMHGWSMSPNFLTYTLSKMALADLTKLLAMELAPRIRINTIAPGAMLPSHMDKPGVFKKLARLTPLKRNSNPSELCDAVSFLLRAESLTGQCIDLSGGLGLGFLA